MYILYETRYCPLTLCETLHKRTVYLVSSNKSLLTLVRLEFQFFLLSYTVFIFRLQSCNTFLDL